MDQAAAVETARIEELLSSYRELQEQFDQVRERLRRAEDHRHTVARRVYDRVRSEYDRELDGIRLRLIPLRDELERVQESLEVQYREAAAALQSVEEELSEATFRHRIGEYPDPTFDEMKRALDAHAEDARSRQTSLSATLATIAIIRSPENAADAAVDDPAAETTVEAPALVVPEVPAEIPSLGAGDANDTEAFTDDPFAVSHDEGIINDDLSAIVVDEPPTLETTYEVVQPEPESTPEPAPALEEPLADVAPEPVYVRNAEPEPQVTRSALINAFENPQQWVSEIPPDTARAERRPRLSQPTPPVAPVRVKPSVQDEIDSVLSPFETAAKAPAPAHAPAGATSTAASPSSLPSLVFVSGPHTGQAIALLPTTLTIGREHDNNVEIKDPEVARYHARILRERDDFVVEDLNSSTGTWINGERKTRAVLSHGDVIRVGQTELALDFEWTTDSK
ncbi:MAG TPA: FHA domain-containing protein [Candidatus Krumholzibacteria bacterium]|nr:FHA domain-containing protein [Candidatus Krumholzibacteria bacterium]